MFDRIKVKFMNDCLKNVSKVGLGSNKVVVDVNNVQGCDRCERG